ncbi:phosphatidylserine decarboxylase [Bythopirellula polymerisocia]|uniref:Phosphatidylserine decarboxylase proenzyme n=1 Tax=Bythopirellula polymerisocia TaxID=2528003 RepID=A0A5C6CH66_9BACT|nr:phosphatidylserine decarboxylase [Bythopirellula polymerisocia]TWU23532.1 phosphatidylserine decarboxylase [Bythopirellula polymerisocia]
MAESETQGTYPPLPENISSVQPGGGICYQIELAWGRWRRFYLRTFRGGYVERLASLRKGDLAGAPHEILDPRDLKYCENLCSAHWLSVDDPFKWRDRLPFARWGLAELQIMGWPLLAMIGFLLWLGCWWQWLAVVPAVILVLIIYFFRDPVREIPADPAAIVSPADGTIAEVTELDHYDFFDGPAMRIGIFLSIFNVHVNRAPRAARVVDMHYKPGEFLNALNPESALRNEYMWIGMEEIDHPEQKLAVRAISGLIARRIVCTLRPGKEVQRGEKFGMIKLGSRTELILPRDAVEVTTAVGDRVLAGSTILARYR